MFHVAKNPIKLPADIEIRLAGQQLSTKDVRGALELRIHPSVEVIQDNGELCFAARNGDQQTRVMTGAIRTLVNSMVAGVDQGFGRKLRLVGADHKVRVKGRVLSLSLGLLHPIDYELSVSIAAETSSQADTLIKDIDKQLIDQVAAETHDFRSPELYKGKGVRYANETVRRKEAKRK